MTIVIDGRVINTEKLLHEALKTIYEFPDYWGDFDALWELLSAWIEFPALIIIKNYEPLLENMKDRFYMLVNVLETAEAELDGFNFVIIPSLPTA